MAIASTMPHVCGKVVMVKIMLLGVPIYVLDRGTRQQRPWHRVSITTSNMEQLTAEQVARIRPPGYPVGQPGEAMYLVRCNDNHWLALGHADGSRLRDGEVDVLKLAEEGQPAVPGIQPGCE
ncbi:hypothetical protein HaLaN_17819, partial [Haematococcus lacustris]